MRIIKHLSESLAPYQRGAVVQLNSLREYETAGETLKAEFGRELHAYSGAKDIQRKAIEGDSLYLDSFAPIYKEITATAAMSRKVYASHLFGDTVNVPRYLTGVPDCMTHEKKILDNRTPITIWVATGRYALLRESSIIKWGAAISALVCKVSRTRPVNLRVGYLSGNPDGKIDGIEAQSFGIFAPVNTRPANESQLSYILCAEDWAFMNFRYLRQAINTAPDYDRFYAKHCGSWRNANATDEQLAAYQADVKRFIGAKPGDLYISRLVNNDAPIVKNPAQWVNENFAKIAAGYRGQ